MRVSNFAVLAFCRSQLVDVIYSPIFVAPTRLVWFIHPYLSLSLDWCDLFTHICRSHKIGVIYSPTFVALTRLVWFIHTYFLF